MNRTNGFLIEYALNPSPLVLVFEFNPQQIARSRTINITLPSAPGAQGDFSSPKETPRVSQGVSMDPESFDIEILLDSTDRMNQGDAVAASSGVEPQLDTLRTMIEPKSQGPGGMQVLASIAENSPRAFQRDTHSSVLLFAWGSHVLPVFLKSIDIKEVAHLPTLIPYRANVTLSLQVIEGGNPFYKAEQLRQIVSSGFNTLKAPINLAGGLF